MRGIVSALDASAPPQVISFDCYGTLVDWESGIVAAGIALAKRRGLTVSAEEILRSYARGESAAQAGPYLPYAEVLRRTYASMCSDLGVPAHPDDADCLIDALRGFVPFGDSVPALVRLQAEGIKLAVLSNVDEDLFASTQDRLGIDFDWVVTAEALGVYKPSPRFFSRGRELFGDLRWLHAGQSLFHDVVPAKRAGIAAAHVTRDVGRDATATPPVSPETLASVGEPDLVVPDLASLADAILPA